MSLLLFYNIKKSQCKQKHNKSNLRLGAGSDSSISPLYPVKILKVHLETMHCVIYSLWMRFIHFASSCQSILDCWIAVTPTLHNNRSKRRQLSLGVHRRGPILGCIIEITSETWEREGISAHDTYNLQDSHVPLLSPFNHVNNTNYLSPAFFNSAPGILWQ